jgi:hypothetical protein
MIMRYLPDVGFEIGSKTIPWGMGRQLVRNALSMKFRQDDGRLDNSQFFDGDHAYDIVYRRDIYSDFTTNFNEEDRLTEWEIHQSHTITVSEIALTFGKDTMDFVRALKTIDDQVVEVEPGNFLFTRLKILLASSGAMGGEGSGLDYVYAAKDINHLLD